MRYLFILLILLCSCAITESTKLHLKCDKIAAQKLIKNKDNPEIVEKIAVAMEKSADKQLELHGVSPEIVNEDNVEEKYHKAAKMAEQEMQMSWQWFAMIAGLIFGSKYAKNVLWLIQLLGHKATHIVGYKEKKKNEEVV